MKIKTDNINILKKIIFISGMLDINYYDKIVIL